MFFVVGFFGYGSVVVVVIYDFQYMDCYNYINFSYSFASNFTISNIINIKYIMKLVRLFKKNKKKKRNREKKGNKRKRRKGRK
jgi:hypothetical protein